MQARVKDKQEVAKGTLLVTFDLLGEEVSFKPGQYFFVTLPDVGHQDDKGLRRHISVVTSPNERGVLGLCTRLRDTAFKRSLAELPVGAEVDVEAPRGTFVLPAETDRPYVFIAGGIGITVFRSMLRYIAEERLPHRVTLVYSNRDRDSAAFLDELRELERDNANFRLVLTMTEDRGWSGETRRIDGDVLRDHVGRDLASYTYLVAGPPTMTAAIVETLEQAGVARDQIRAERFTGY
ncbi:MAG: FAD-dependent oxidoreductase [Actinomycetota bacterium]|nr:FAD-dependent oxidoreductase [Actinomycetota bacterium]